MRLSASATPYEAASELITAAAPRRSTEHWEAPLVSPGGGLGAANVPGPLREDGPSFHFRRIFHLSLAYQIRAECYPPRLGHRDEKRRSRIDL